MITFFRENSWLRRKDYERELTRFFSDPTAIGMIGGGVSTVVSAFFGYSCLYPATITGFSFCAWAGRQICEAAVREEILRKKLKEKLLHVESQDPESTLKWKEFMRWQPICLAVFNSNKKEEFIEVRAFTNGTDLKYRALNLRKKTETSGPIKFDGSINKMMRNLKESFATLEDDGTPVFSRSYHTLYHIWEGFYRCRREEIRLELLLRQNNNLIWNIYYANNSKVIATQQNSLSTRCEESVKNFFEIGKCGSLITRINLARELIPYRCSHKEICFEPFHVSSGFHRGILVSKFMWAVTLVRYEGISGNHAEIIIEGINDGFISEEDVPIGHYFMCIAHLRGSKNIKKDDQICEVRDIEMKFYKTFNLKYEARSETWRRPGNSVKDMMTDIYEEEHNPPPGFALYGRHSFFANTKDGVQDSCITWAINKLENVNVFLEPTTFGSLFTDTSVYTPLKPDESST